MSNLPVPIGGTVMISAELTEALSSAEHYARNEKAEATRRSYETAWRRFEDWCERNRARAMPAHPKAVEAFVAYLADSGLKVATIDKHVAAITYRHRMDDRDGVPPTSSEGVKAVLRGIRRTLGTRPDRKAPVTDKHLRAMLKALPDSLAGLRDRAMLAIGFAAAMRRSELVALDVRHIERTPEGILVNIDRSKTDQEAAGRQVPILRGSKLKPVYHLDAWLVAAGITVGALFRPVAKGGHVLDARLNDRSVAETVKRAAELAKLDPSLFSGHSLRAGFVTSALEHGADPMKVMDITGHKQVQTLKIYDRRAQAFKNHAGKGFL